MPMIKQASQKNFLDNRVYDGGEGKQKFVVQEIEYKSNFMIKNYHGSWQWCFKYG